MGVRGRTNVKIQIIHVYNSYLPFQNNVIIYNGGVIIIDINNIIVIIYVIEV